MNRSKILEFFDATKYKMSFHIIGCGAIGSHVCEEFARLGFPEVHLYDFDTVSAHNVTNQMFKLEDIGKPKTQACKEAMLAINPEMKIICHEDGLGKDGVFAINGVCILCVDNIDLRRTIVKTNHYNPYCKAILDFRMRLTDAQYYFASGDNQFEKDTLLSTMDFTHEEATAATPTSACGVELNVVYTVKAITAFGMSNLIRWLQGEPYKTMILVDMNMFTVDAFKAAPRKCSKVKDFVNLVATAKRG